MLLSLRGQKDKKRQKRRTQNKQAESAAGNYFQAGTFRLPGKQSASKELYDIEDIEKGQDNNIEETNLDDVD